MDYRDRIVLSQKQKQRLSFKLDKDVVSAVKDNLQMIGLDQSNFLTGFFANVANTGKLPFKLLDDNDRKKAQLAAELASLEPKWDDVPEIENEKE